jgi:hypothetical protein
LRSPAKIVDDGELMALLERRFMLDDIPGVT